MYQFVTGSLARLSFGIFFVGIIVRAVLYIKDLDWKLDGLPYIINVSCGIQGAIRSISFWLLPFGTRGWRTKPGFTVLFFVFHACIILIPLFLAAHNVLLKERCGISLWRIPDFTTDFFDHRMHRQGICS